IEKIFYNTNPKTVITVSQARGVCLMYAGVYNLTVKEYTPLQVKNALVGYGRAEKKQVQYMVTKMLNLKEVPKPDDAADALAIAVCAGLEYYKL
ncbi:MAG TPA: crossover junction endodeoxyribonuclease RuvC, partial [candidate division WWE3 bacterium]|nr:crossover junction endodeoxyribonuclease RuvC [candidate division WWE3 bacterium]